MFIFDQMHAWYKTAWDFYVMSVRSFVFDRVIEQEVTEVQIMFPIFIDTHAQGWIKWTVDSQHNRLDFESIFKCNKPNINVIKNIRRK